MDSLPSSQVSPEQTRESLIAISQTLPDKVPLKPHLDSLADASVTDKTNTPGEEEYRSKLISISYTPSPDTKITTPREEEYRSKLISISCTPSPDTKITTPESPAIVDG